MCSGRGAPCSYPGSASSRLCCCCCCYWLLLDSLARSLWLTLLLQTSRPTRRTSTSHSITIATAMRRLMVVVMWRRRSSSCSASARPRKPRCGARRRAARLPRSRSLPTVVRANQRTNSTCSTSLCFACTRWWGCRDLAIAHCSRQGDSCWHSSAAAHPHQAPGRHHRSDEKLGHLARTHARQRKVDRRHVVRHLYAADWRAGSQRSNVRLCVRVALACCSCACVFIECTRSRRH